MNPRNQAPARTAARPWLQASLGRFAQAPALLCALILVLCPLVGLGQDAGQPAGAGPDPARQAEAILAPLSGHAVLLLLVQLALLLFAARLGAELAKRIGLPAVVGELAAGIALGPSLLGHLAPGVFAAVFPHDAAQFHLLEAIGTLGMVLLLLLTGIETDLKLLRNLGRAALITSTMGMVLPFASGFVLGSYIPDSFLADPERRTLFSFFLATAMAISAMPVIAKILIDLDLTKRNIGLVILSAVVVDDTAGWLILSLIVGAASSGVVRIGGLVNTLLLTGGFLVAMAFLVYPLSRWLMTQSNRKFRTHDSDMVFLLVLTFLCAAATEWIGVHAVFGAFICGVMFKQIPQLEAATVHRLEVFVYSILAPIFFGIVGLKVDLWALGGGTMLAAVLSVACLGKLIGCTLGSVWGGMRFWEGLSIAVAMNARGAMELVVASIGLSLGILNQQMFSIIVVVAIVTTFMAPIGLRLTMRKVPLSEEEALRIAAQAARGVLDPERVRVLVATAGGPTAVGAALLARGLCARSSNPVEVIFVKQRSGWRARLLRTFTLGFWRHDGEDDLRIQSQLRDFGLVGEYRVLEHADPGAAIVAESRKGCEFLVLGTSLRSNSQGSHTLEQIVGSVPCHLAMVKSEPRSAAFRRVVVAFDDSVFARLAVEVAVRYCEAENASLTLVVSSEQRPPASLAGLGLEAHAARRAGATPEGYLEKISPVFRNTHLRPEIVRLAEDSDPVALYAELTSGRHDLVVVGAERRTTQPGLFFGNVNEGLINQSAVAVAIIVPNVARLG